MSVINAAIAGGTALVGGAMASRSANKASQRQAKASGDSLALQKQMFDEQNSVAANMLRAQTGTADQNSIRNKLAARTASATAERQARNLYQQSARRAAATQGANIGDFQRERTNGSTRLANARDASISGINEARDFGTGEIRGASRRAINQVDQARDYGTTEVRGARDKSITGVNQARDYGTERIEVARDQSVKPFQMQSDLGNNALLAYGQNLGVGPGLKGYNMEMTPGNRYLLDEGSKAVEGGAAARGGLYSGAAMEEMQRHAMGIAAQDRGQQQAELFGLGGLGQSAANSMAGIRMGAAGDIAGLHTGAAGTTANLRTGAAGDIANLYTGAAGTNAGIRMGAAGDIAGLHTGAAGTNANLRTGAAGDINALRGGYTGQITGARDTYTDRMGQYGINQANGLTGAADTLAQREIGIGDTRMSALGQARANRSQLLGSASQSYGAFGGQAIQNSGDAQAAGVMGGANAWTNALNGGFQTYGMMGGQMPQLGRTNPFTPQQQLPAANYQGQGRLY